MRKDKGTEVIDGGDTLKEITSSIKEKGEKEKKKKSFRTK